RTFLDRDNCEDRRGRTSRCVIGCGNRAAVRKRLLPRQNRSREDDQKLSYPLLDRACDAVLRVPQEPRRHFLRRRQGAFWGEGDPQNTRAGQNRPARRDSLRNLAHSIRSANSESKGKSIVTSTKVIVVLAVLLVPLAQT